VPHTAHPYSESIPIHSTDGMKAKRLLIISIACGLLSTSMKRRFNSKAATPVVPLPAKKSNTISPGLDEAWIIRRKMPRGFCVG